MTQKRSQRDPIFLSNNWGGYWTEKVDPKGAEKGALSGAAALESASKTLSVPQSPWHPARKK
jgi:hypothetical protein